MVRKVLGKGLDAILPQAYSDAERESSFSDKEIPVSIIDPNPEQPREKMDPDLLKELAQSIREKGIIQPLIVKVKGNRYQLVAGERRLRACELAGKQSVPVIIKDIADDDMLLIALIENIQREDLNPIEEARAYETLLNQRNMSQEQLASLVGKERSTVANTLRLLKLPRYILEALSEKKLTSGHCRALLMLEDEPGMMKKLFLRIVEKEISVREAERLARGFQEEKERSIQHVRTEKDPFIADAERRLCDRLSARVTIEQRDQGKGKIVISYATDEDLQRIFETLMNIKY